MRLTDKTALITGGAQGIGFAIAQLFCREGADVFICDLNEEQGKDAAEKLAGSGGKAYFITLDVSSEAGWKNAVDIIISRSGKLDVLVNNAGINIRKNIEEMSGEELDRMYSVNIKGPFLGTKYVIPVMKTMKGGSIINMSSVCGLIGHRYTPEAYTTTKGAITLLTKSVASRYGIYNIRCNSLHPSTADTPLVRQFLKDPQRMKERIDEVPLGRLADVSDIAEAALYLASEGASFINGVSMPVDGGATAC